MRLPSLPPLGETSRPLRRRTPKFWADTPSHRNAFALYAGEWASDLAEIDPDLPHSGTPMFKHDPRPRFAATLGTDGRLDGMSVLELGPLEGAHSYQLEQLGAASVVAVESNADAFQRCLIVKNALALDRTTFLLGDCERYLESCEHRFDLVLASGILYHMADPLRLIALIARRTDRVFVWTQCYDEGFRYKSGKRLPFRRVDYARDGLAVEAFEHVYRDRLRRRFTGGIRPRAIWLRRDDVVAALRHYGFDDVQIISEEASSGGPAVSLTARRTPPPA